MNIIDMHCDTISKLFEDSKLTNGANGSESAGNSLRRAQGYQVDLEKMRRGGYLLQNFALFVDKRHVKSPFEEALAMAQLYKRELANHQDLIAPALCYDDILANQANGKMSALLTLEEGGILEGSLDNLRRFYREGVRMITLTWNYENEIGFPNLRFDADGQPLFSQRESRGLTAFGKELVCEMERLGVIIDVSHASDGCFWDVLDLTEKPFVASHSNAAALCGVCRNLTDRQIRALAERGGLMGLNFCAAFLTDRAVAAVSSLSDMVRHVRHIMNVGGIEVCALGSDFDGIVNAVEFGDASGMPMLADALKKAGFTESEVDKIFFQNALRLYREVFFL